MTEMVERVAKAIMETNEQTSGLSYSELVHEMARAAIKAMREPTEEIVAGTFLMQKPDDCEERTLIWQGMIDAALEEK